MKHLLLVFVLVSCMVSTNAQSPLGSVSVTVTDPDHKALGDATVALLRSKDSALVSTALTNASGEAFIENLKTGSYLLRVSMINFEPAWSNVFTVGQSADVVTLPVMILKPLARTLENVTVLAKKPFLQRLSDRIVVNVDNSIVNFGSAALDVLERSPGIQLDINDNITMRGRSGVTIMIDGKPSPMTGADLVNFLRGLPANAIESIHLITNPSAKYDAAGNSGIIDIRMKKDQRLGANGTVNAGYGQGVYPKANAGITFNYRNKKVNLFGNYSYGYRMNLNHLLLDRNFYTDGKFSGKDEKNNYTKIPVNFHSARAGADFYLGKKTILGFVATGNLSDARPGNNNHSVVIDEDDQPMFRFQTQTENHNQNSNVVLNLNVKHSFDSAGRELTADIDYGYFKSDLNSSTATQYYNLDGSSMQPDYILQGVQTGRLDFKTAKVDYVHPFSKSTKLEAGGKLSFVSSDNDAKFYDVSSGVPVVDASKTNRFFYDENNNAGYVNVQTLAGKWDMQFGLRAEQTNVKTRQEQGDTRWDSSYLQWFPSAFLTYKVKPEHALGISVSRRIDRPGYAQLNPFLFLIDVTTYSTGNPGLLPQFTWSYELSYTIKSLHFTLAYSRTNRSQNIVIARFKDVFPNIPADDNVTVQIPVNLASNDYFGLTVAAPVRITKWWNSINNLNVFYNHFNGTLGSTNLNSGKAVANMSTNNTFTLGKGWSTELNGSYNSGGQYGFMVMNDQWGIGAGVQKTMIKGKGTLRFSITDIFWTNLPSATITFDNYIEYWKAYRETRVANLQFTYRFGNSKVQAARRRSLGSEEERQRAQ